MSRRDAVGRHPEVPTVKLIAAGVTNVGMKRAHNEDNHILVPEENLFVVADGMGGHASGEVASELAVNSVADFFKITTADEEQTWPYKEEKGLKLRGEPPRRRHQARQPAGSSRPPRPTSASAAWAPPSSACCSPKQRRLRRPRGRQPGLPRFRNNKLEQLTDDHSLLNDYLKNHKLTPEEIEAFPHKNVIVRALGMKDSVQVDVSRLEPLPNDLYLLCSDGLSGMVKDADMEALCRDWQNDPARTDNVDGLCHELVAAANRNGGTDNVTTVIIKVIA
jgi:PPM family protein phosphatase